MMNLSLAIPGIHTRGALSSAALQVDDNLSRLRRGLFEQSQAIEDYLTRHDRVLMAAGWVAVLSDASMSLTRDGAARQFRLDRFGIDPDAPHQPYGSVLMLTERDCRSLARSWNNQLLGRGFSNLLSGLTVYPMPLDRALAERLKGLDLLLGALRGEC